MPGRKTTDDIVRTSDGRLFRIPTNPPLTPILLTDQEIDDIVAKVGGDKVLIKEMLTGVSGSPPPPGPSPTQAKKSGGPPAKAIKDGPGIWPLKM